MDILVIGNGFDLAHGLPTTYSDFLRFMKAFTLYDNAEESQRKNLQLEEKSERYRNYISTLFEKTDEKSRKIIVQLQMAVDRNKWLQHFYGIYQKREKDGQDTWINFENEISGIIQILDEIRGDVFRNTISETDKVTVEHKLLSVVQPFIYSTQEESGYDDLSREILFDTKKKLLDDLNNLIRGLEIYLSDYIEKIEVTCRLPDVKEMAVDKVLTFNYTDTYKRLYTKGSGDVQYDYIHGKAEIEHDLENCDLVLGIDEYLDDEEKDVNTSFIEFKKFYQRIVKQTQCQYKGWVKELSLYNPSYRTPLDEDNLYIVGHSLDVTDRDILRSLILNDSIKTTIFYYNRQSFGKLVANLVKLIGQDELIKRAYSNMPTIIFKKQRDAVVYKDE